MADTHAGMELRLHQLDDPGTVLARVSRTDRWVAEDLPEWTESVVRAIVAGTAQLFAQREYDVIRAMGGHGPVGSTLDRPPSRRSRRTRHAP